MLLSTKKMAFLGVLLALTIVIVILSGVLEFNTLFLLAAASFGIGIAIREGGIRIGFGFYLAVCILSLILAPNKLYCITFAAMGLYLVIAEYAYDKLVNMRRVSNRRKLLWVIKYLVFNLLYLPLLYFFPKLIYQGNMTFWLIGVLLLAGQVALYIYDWAYGYFQRSIWGNVRGKLKL